jgi:hypothetical protein
MGEEAKRPQDDFEDEEQRLKEQQLKDDDLEKENGEALPERQAMSTVRVPLHFEPDVVDVEPKIDSPGDPI